MHKRLKDHQWTVAADDNGSYSHAAAQLTVLMDIRDEAKETNRLLRVVAGRLAPLECPNFLTIPRTLKAIQRNTTKKRRTPR